MKQLVADDNVYRSLRERFADYFDGGMGAEAIKRLLQDYDVVAEGEALRDTIENGKGTKRLKAIKRLKVASNFVEGRSSPMGMVLDADPGDPAGPASDGAARRWPVRDLRPERPVPARDQPEQPAEAAARPAGARDHRQQREADAPGGRRRAVRQRPARPPGHRARQPPAEVALRHAEGQAGPVPPEPARQARRLLGPLGHRGRAGAPPAPVRAARSRWRWSCSSRS